MVDTRKPDEEMKAVNPDGQTEETTMEPHQLGILSLIKAAQNQNGLRHSDYGRYHRYCTRRMLRLRKCLGFAQTKRVNRKQEYDPKTITLDLAKENVRYLQILVFKCEADWAYAMQMKQAATNLTSKNQSSSQQVQALGGNRNNPQRLRVHYLKRFRAAAKTATFIQSKCSEAFDSQSVHELEAYTNFLQAVSLMESLKHEDAMDHLLKAQVIYKQIADHKDPLEALIYTEKVNQLQTYIRSCAAHLKIASSESILHQDASKIQQSIKEAFTKTDTADTSDGLASIRVNGKDIPLKADKIKLVFAKIKEQTDALDALKARGQETLKEQISLHLSIANTLDDAAFLIAKEKKEEVKKNEASGQLLNSLLLHVQKLKYETQIERNMIQANELYAKIDLSQLFAQDQAQRLQSEFKPQNIVRFVEKALKAQRALSKLDKETSDPFSLLFNEFKELYLKCLLALYITLHYSNERKFNEAYVLAQHTINEIATVSDFAQKGFFKAGKPASGLNPVIAAQVQQNALQLSDEIKPVLERVSLKAHASLLLEQAADQAQMIEKFEEVQIDTAEPKPEGAAEADRQVKAETLFEMLFDSHGQTKNVLGKKVVICEPTLEILESGASHITFENISQQKANASLEQLKLNKHLKIVNTIPRFQSVPATAHLFDLAGSWLDYPNLSEEATQFELTSGWRQSIGSFFGRKK